MSTPHHRQALPETKLPRACARLLSWCHRRPLRALTLAQHLAEATPADASAWPWVQLTLGWCYLVCEQPAAAKSMFDQAAIHLTPQHTLWGHIRTRHGLLRTELMLQQSAVEVEQWAQLATEAQQANLPQEAALILIGMMRIANIRANMAQVFALQPHLQQLLTDHPDLATQALFDRVVGVAYLQSGDFVAANQHLQRAEQLLKQLRWPIELAHTWFEQARLALAQEAFAASEELHLRAETLFRQMNLEVRVAYCQKNHGILALKNGQFGRAIAYTLAARATFEQQHQLTQVADCTLNLGAVSYHIGLFDLALATWCQAELLYQQLGMAGMALKSQRNQADAYYRLHQWDAAAALLQQLIPIAQQLEAAADLAEIYQLQGELLLARGDHQTALPWLELAEAQFLSLPSRSAAARVWLVVGWHDLVAGRIAEAQQQFEMALPELRSRQSYAWRAYAGLGHCAEQQGQPIQALDYYYQACRCIADLRHTISQTHASSGLFGEAQHVFDSAIQLALATGQPDRLLALTEEQRAIALQQQLRHQHWMIPDSLQPVYEERRQQLHQAVISPAPTQLEHAITQYLDILLLGRHAAEYLNKTPISVEAFQLPPLRHQLTSAFQDEWSVLSFVTTGQQLLIVVLTPTDLWVESIVVDTTITSSLRRLREPGYRQLVYRDLAYQADQTIQPWADFTLLGEQLIPASLRPRLTPHHRLIIIPGEALANLPWAALRIHGHWLIERAIVQIVPSLTIWHTLTERQPSGDQALLVGISEFGQRAAPLPHALASLDLAERHWPGPITRWENQHVQREQLRQAAQTGQLAHYRLIHFAMHGQQVPRHGVMAHLKLSDDNLLVDDIAELRLGAACVILAACDGAAEAPLPGDELLSLNRALLAAGAQDVIASLWQLYDQTIMPLLDQLYRALAQGVDPPTALAYTQRQLLHSPDPFLHTPLIWASLCAIGAGVQPIISPESAPNQA